MPKKIPLRQCLGCREMKPKQELIRVGRSPEGDVSLDFKGKLPGYKFDIKPASAPAEEEADAPVEAEETVEE